MKIAAGTALVACPACTHSVLVRVDTVTATCQQCGNKWQWKNVKLKLATRPR